MANAQRVGTFWKFVIPSASSSSWLMWSIKFRFQEFFSFTFCAHQAYFVMRVRGSGEGKWQIGRDEDRTFSVIIAMHCWYIATRGWWPGVP